MTILSKLAGVISHLLLFLYDVRIELLQALSSLICFPKRGR